MDAPRPTKDFARNLRRRPSLPEGLIWRLIKERKLGGLRFRRQHPLGRYVLDFYCHEARLAIEVDGQSHSVGERPGRDQTRDLWLRNQGIKVLRLSAAHVLKSPQDAVQTIRNFLRETGSPGASTPSVGCADTSP